VLWMSRVLCLSDAVAGGCFGREGFTKSFWTRLAAVVCYSSRGCGGLVPATASIIRSVSSSCSSRVAVLATKLYAVAPAGTAWLLRWCSLYWCCGEELGSSIVSYLYLEIAAGIVWQTSDVRQVLASSAC
jgi:hypothetical protein